MSGRFHIIGAGLSGLAAAVELVEKQQTVTLYESAPEAGGRCRSFHDTQLGVEVDNGNHLLIGANKQAIKFLRKIGASELWQKAGSYRFYDIQSGESWRLSAPFWLPAPVMRQLPTLIRFLRFGKTGVVADYFRVDSLLYQRFIRPLCISALNTMPEEADAALMRAMLLILLRNGPGGARALYAKQPLGSSLIHPAIAYVKRRNVTFRMPARLQAVDHDNHRITALHFAKESISISERDHILFAGSLASLATLFPGWVLPDQYESILNLHFKLDMTHKALAHLSGFYGFTGGMVEWMFIKKGIISTTTSAANRFIRQSPERLAAQGWEDITRFVGEPLALPPYRVVMEKRATFKASPDQQARRPALGATRLTNFWLAGDYTQTGLPATIEGSIRSGLLAAQSALTASGLH